MKTVQKITPVWDLAIRIFHWLLVISFVTSYLTGDEEDLIHVYSGYLIIGLLCFRVVWGLIGSQHARFTDFIYRPSRVLGYAKGMLSGNIEHVKGHNPLGGLMVITLLLSLTLTTLSGLKVYGLEGEGPLAENPISWFINDAKASSPMEQGRSHAENEKDEHFWEEIHEFFANFTVALVVFHILGVVVSSRLEKQNLVRAMITGRKEYPTS